jgi:aminopeptidase N
MEWWNGLWLNEGFARYVEHIGVNAAEPTWLMVNICMSFRPSYFITIISLV